MKILLEVGYMSQELRTQLCKVAKEWLALQVKYEHRGLTRNGCDCTGLIIGALRELGYLKTYVLRNYSRDWNLHAGADNYIVEEAEKVADKVESPIPGDIVLFHFCRCVAHAGIIVENKLFIHCHMNSKQCIVSKLWNSSWTKRIAHFYRFNEKKLRRYG